MGASKPGENQWCLDPTDQPGSLERVGGGVSQDKRSGVGGGGGRLWGSLE